MKNSEPLISIIMNCYNGSKYVAEAIQSVLDQTYKNWELVFWDNQSKDDTAQIVKSFQDSRIKYYYAPEHTKLGAARNLAAAKTSGEWIGFLDTDDVWLPEKLERQVNVICEIESESLGLVYTRCVNFGDRIKTQESVHHYIGKPLPSGRILGEYLSVGNFIPLVSAIVRRSSFEKVGGIPSAMNQAEDYYLFAAIAANHDVAVVQDVCCKYRIHSSNLTHSQIQLGWQEAIFVLETFESSLSATESNIRKAVLVSKHEFMLRISLKNFAKDRGYSLLVDLDKIGVIGVYRILMRMFVRRVINRLKLLFYPI